MKLWDVIKSVGSNIIRETVPGGGLILGAVNELLPDDKKLTAGATGTDLNNAISSLPPDQQRQLLEKEFDVDITQIKESNSTLRTMLESDAKNPHSTRPYIAKGAFFIVAFANVVSVSTWAYGVLIENDKITKTVTEGWPFILSVIGPLVSLLWAYFGILKQEHKTKLNAAGGNTDPSGITGIISSLIRK